MQLFRLALLPEGLWGRIGLSSHRAIQRACCWTNWLSQWALAGRHSGSGSRTL